jgi:hypothetical protein
VHRLQAACFSFEEQDQWEGMRSPALTRFRYNAVMKPAVLFLMLASLPVAVLAQLVPDSFEVPTSYTGANYKLVPLGPGVAELDYKAYMSSIDHIRKSQGGNWPRPELTMADQAKDMAGEKAQWDGRKSYPFAVLSADGRMELGCFYLRPSPKEGYDVVATMWVTKDQFEKGLEDQLYKDMKVWVAQAWPFKKVAWRGREISPEAWKALPDKSSK